MPSQKSPGSTRSTLGNRALVLFTFAYLAAAMAEFAFFVAGLVYAYDRGGSRTAGFAAILLLVPTALAAPVAGAAAQRLRPNRVRLAAYAGQTGAAVGAYVDAPVIVVIGCCAAAAYAFTFLGPACAIVLPAIVRSARELTVANVWVGSCESVSVLGGGALATLLLAVDGPALVLAGCAALSVTSVVVTVGHRDADLPPGSCAEMPDGVGATRLVLRSIRALRRRPGATGVLAVAGVQYLLMGSLDLVVVVLAIDALHMHEAGPGLLATSVGLGGLLCAITSTFLVRRGRLAPLLLAGLASVVIVGVVLGVAPTLATALILLPIAGFSGSLLNLASRILLQRASPPEALGGVFGTIELLAGIGMLAGSLITQVLIALGGVQAALVGLGAIFALLLALTWRSLRIADASADIPVVAISLLRRLPAFAPLPPLALEAVARTAIEVDVEAGEVVVRQGDEGDRFYAVADGAFDIVSGGLHVSTAERGGCFGEVALLANVARTATITARRPGSLLAIDRVPFLVAVTGCDSSRQAAWGVIRAMDLGLAVDA